MAKILKKTKRDPLGRFVTPHRGTDIGTSSGVHLHYEAPEIVVGTVAVWDGSTWVPWVTPKLSDLDEDEGGLVPTIEIGWYQDQEATLSYYEGEGHWRGVDLQTNKKLTRAVAAGTLEYIG